MVESVSWRNGFKQALFTGRIEPRYLLEWVQIPFGTLRVFGGNVRLSSFEIGPGYQPIIDRSASSFSGGVLSIRDWSCSPLMFDVGILGDNTYDVRTIAQRGQGVVLKMGFSDDPADFEAVAVGTIVGLSRRGSGWVIRCKGLEGSLGSRITTEPGEQTLGWDLATETAASYDDGGTLTVAISTAAFRTDGQGTGCVKLTDDAGEDYYVLYTGTTATTFTGCTTGHFGTVFDTTNNSTSVTEVMYTSAHPTVILARILTSTGNANNGPDDILPESWGLGIPAEHLADRDIDTFRLLLQPTSGSALWHWVQPEEIENPQSAIATWANGAGYFLTQHQGEITARGALTPWTQNSPDHYTLTDAMIASIDGYDAWDPDSPIEYSRARALYADGTTANTTATSALDHIPAQDLKTHTMGGVWADTTNEAAIVTELIGRIKHWDQRTPEILTLTLRGLWPGLAAPGSTISLAITVLTSRTSFDFRGQGGLLVRTSADFFGMSTDVEIAVLPADETVPWRA